MSDVFLIKSERFEGPLDLLLSLIEEKKLLVNDFSLSKVADDFLAFIQGRGSFPMGEAAQFILVSATLLLLKSRTLLPALTLSDDEEGDIKDLEFRLRLYQVYRDISKKLGGLTKHMFFGTGADIVDPLFTPSRDLSVDSLTAALRSTLQQAPHVETRAEVSVKTIISLEEMIARLSERIQTALSLSFKDFAAGSEGKRELVVSFLAMLELVKRGMLEVNQEYSFGDIAMNYQGPAQAPKFE